MRAAVFDAFGGPIRITDMPDPTPARDGAVIQVMATGLCRSDWHAWQGHDSDVKLPHVPGHELAGVVAAVGADVKRWSAGDRVTVPFVCACGVCPQCVSGNHQVCDHQFQPGFTHWGSFAEYVSIGRADINLVKLPTSLDFVTAASLGCRFATSFRAVVDQARVSAGEWVAVYGCGGVGLSAIMIASALGASIVAVDIAEDKLALARKLGAVATVNSTKQPDVVATVREITGGGAHVSVDALGHPATCFNSISSLRKRGRHVQVGLLLAGDSKPPIPMDRVVAHELMIMGSHGMQAHRYEAMLRMVENGTVDPARLVRRTIPLEEAPAALAGLGEFGAIGITVIDRF